MKIKYASDTPHGEIEAQIFAQGADEIASDGKHLAGLWFSHTPVHDGQQVGAIGACQLPDAPSASEFLTQCADHLHAKHGCKNIVGPMNGNTWLKHRLLLESNGRPAFAMEPMEPEHYLHAFTNAGFNILSRYSSSTIDLQSEQRSFKGLEDKLVKKGILFRNIKPKQYEQDLEAIHRLSLISFANNFLYTPLPLNAFMQTYQKAKDNIDIDMVILAEWHGKLVGFVFCMPDQSTETPDAPKTLIVKTLAVDPHARLAGLGSILVAKAHLMAQSKGYHEAIHALQHENNSSLRISQRFDAKVFRRYALVVKSYTNHPE